MLLVGVFSRGSGTALSQLQKDRAVARSGALHSVRSLSEAWSPALLRGLWSGQVAHCCCERTHHQLRPPLQ